MSHGSSCSVCSIRIVQAVCITLYLLMFYRTGLVRPHSQYVAETVVLLTSMRSKRTEYNACKAAIDLLETKAVHRKVLDLNKDAQAGTEQYVASALARLAETDQLVRFKGLLAHDVNPFAPKPNQSCSFWKSMRHILDMLPNHQITLLRAIPTSCGPSC